MNHPSHQLLSSLGANGDLSSSTVAELFDDALQCIDRSDLVVVSFSGSDAAKFIQLQTCNDHTAVTPTTAQLNGYCSPKGRLLAAPWVALDATGETIHWLLPRDVADSVVKRLTMFVMRDDVKIQIENDWAVIGLVAADGCQTESLQPWLGSKEMAHLSSWACHDHRAIKTRSTDDTVQVLLYGAIAALEKSLAELSTAVTANDTIKLRTASAATWHLADIRAGVPSVVAATQDRFLPQMMNMGAIDGLSFTKGCYPGQEIVARMHYLGKLKRTMVHLLCAEATAAVATGSAVSCGSDDSAGEVVQAVIGADGLHCLVVVKTSAELSDFSIDGLSCEVQDLPYTVELEYKK